MRVAITGTNGIGKSTLIQDMLNQWPGYITPQTSYRELIDDRYTTVMNETTQQQVLDSMIDQLKSYGKDDHVIYDRCPIDNLVYSLHGNTRNTISDKFIEDCARKIKQALRLVDLIFFIPITSQDDVDISNNIKGKGDLTLEYATEIDNLFKSVYRQWDNKESPFVDYEDKPHVIEVFGTPEQRLEMIKLYITDSGDMFEDSVILSPSEIMEMEALYSAIAKEPVILEKETDST